MKKVVKKENKDSYFDGKPLKLFKYKLLFFITTIFTFGLVSYLPLYKLLEYEINHTVLNGKRLKFFGDRTELFYLRLKWLLYSLITLGIFIFFIPTNTFRWVVNNVGFEDQDHLDNEDSFFRGNIVSYSGLYLLCNFLNIVSFGLMYPFSYTLLYKEITKKTYLNRLKVIYKGESLDLLLKYLKWFTLTIITLGIYGIWADFYKTKYIVSNIHLKKEGDQDESDNNIIFIASLLVLGFAIFLLLLKFLLKIL